MHGRYIGFASEALVFQIPIMHAQQDSCAEAEN